jgi:hypothetical protein
MARQPKPTGGRSAAPRTRADLIRAMRRHGWTVTIAPGGHTKAHAPGGRFVIFPTTGSDARGIRNTLRDVRRVTGWDFRLPDPRPEGL